MICIDVKVTSPDFKKGSTLHMVFVQGELKCSFVGLNARYEANFRARTLEREAYDRLDAYRKSRGLVKVSRPNV